MLAILPVYLYVYVLLLMVYIWCTMSGLFLFYIIIWIVCVHFFIVFCCSTLSCFLSDANSLKRRRRTVVAFQTFSLYLYVFLSLVCNVVSTLMCPLSELHPSRTPLCDWTVCLWKMQCIQVKTASRQSQHASCHTQQRPCGSESYGHASLPESSHNLFLLLLLV